MHPGQPVSACTVFDGCHLVDWQSNDYIVVLGADHKTRVWQETSAGTYRLKDGDTP